MLAEWRAVTSASRVYGGIGYEISDDLQRRRVEVLEKRYGGRQRAHAAATVIQKAFRKYTMNSRFNQIKGDGSSAMRTSMICNGSSPADCVRYAPTTSLSAQLRADRVVPVSASTSAMTPDRCRTRSPPSPSPRARNERSMIDSLMSPRLISRRLQPSHSSNPLSSISSPTSALMTSSPCSSMTSPLCLPAQHTAHVFTRTSLSTSSSTVHSSSPSGSDGLSHGSHYKNPSTSNANIWIPRQNGTSNVSLTNNHCNSLPRFERKHQQPRVPRYDDAEYAAARRINDIERRREYRIALNFFNKKPERGIQLLMSWNFIDERPESVAKLLFARRGLSRQMVGDYLGVLRTPFNSLVLEYFMAEIDVRNLEIDVALRKVLHFFRLPGESQKIERILNVFSMHYARSNPAIIARFKGGASTIFVLSYAIIMLNTDLHNKSIRPAEKMKKDQFINNLRDIDNGDPIEKSILTGIYARVKETEFRTGDDHVTQVTKVEAALIGDGKPRITDTHRRLVCYCRMNQIIDVNKKQAVTSHERDIFLFNDMIVVTKVAAGRKKDRSSQYTFKTCAMLLGAKAEVFSRNAYEFGVLITTAEKQQIALNARNHDDRCRFIADVRESIAETQGMERVRLELEMERVSLRTDSQRDSGLPDADLAEPGVVIAPEGRRLSGHSMDSGVAEEGFA